MTESLDNKIRKAVKLIQLSAPEDGSPIEVAYSGGKDSDVILQLVKESGVNYRAIYKNTTIDSKGTMKHVREMGAEVVNPEKGFFQIIKESGYPDRFRRMCCSRLKEYKILDKCVMGVRKEESTKRAKIYKEPTACRYYGSKKNHVEAIYPILDWTLQDVSDFLKDRNIRCADVYYDKDGNFHPERRLGCMGCPLASRKKRIEQFKENIPLLRAYIRAGQTYMDTHPQASLHKKYNNAYEYMARELFFNKQEEWEQYKNGLFETIDCKEFMEKYFNAKL